MSENLMASYFGISIWMYPPLRNLRCSPSGSFTTNSLRKVEMLRFETTVHSHFLTPSTASGTWILRFSFTLTWQPRRQWSLAILREMKPVSVGRMSPPPSSTWHLHMPHEPPPPQADGRKTLLLASVASSVEPLSVRMTFSPLLMSIVTSPEEVSLAFA